MAIRLMWVRDWPYGKEDGQVIENAELVASYRTDAPDIARRLQSALARIATLEAELAYALDYVVPMAPFNEGDIHECRFCYAKSISSPGDIQHREGCLYEIARARREAREKE